jgi:hypothetical protein
MTWGTQLYERSDRGLSAHRALKKTGPTISLTDFVVASNLYAEVVLIEQALMNVGMR